MAEALRLRVALKRGAWVALANWPMVVVGFVAQSLYGLALSVPVIGGVFMVAVLAGEDVTSMLSDGLRAAAGRVFESLLDAPAAFASFIIALGVVAAGAGVVTFLARAGALAVVTTGERAAARDGQRPSRSDIFSRAAAYGLDPYLSGVRQFGRRYVSLGVGVLGAYAFVGVSYAVIVVGSYRWSSHSGWSSAWPLVAVIATSGAVVAVTVVNLCCDLLQVIMTSDDCRLRAAAPRMWRFLIQDARQVAGIFGVVLTLVVLATAASTLVTAGLGLVALVPLVGLAVFPLQAAAWLVRGLVFEYLALTALTAYVSQYRRFTGGPDDDAASPAGQAYLT